MERTYQVTYACASLDPNPVVKTFDLSEFDEMNDWIEEEVERRIQFFVDDSQGSITNDEYWEQRELEYSLIQVKEI